VLLTPNYPMDVFCKTYALTVEELVNLRQNKVTEIQVTQFLGERFRFVNFPLMHPVFLLMVCDPEELKTDVDNRRVNRQGCYKINFVST